MNMTALVCVFLSLLLAVFSTGNVTPPDPPDFVYRVDFRKAGSIFKNGFQSWGKCENVYAHVDGKNLKESAFISTTSEDGAAEQIVEDILNHPRNTKMTIYVYKIRADQRFYSADYSLMTAAERYWHKEKREKADKYERLAIDYKWQKEWFAYKVIPSTMIQQVTTYERNLVNQKIYKGLVVQNSHYVAEDTVANRLPFPESTKGCGLLFDKLKARLVVPDHKEQQ